jgi:hypothetical protein
MNDVTASIIEDIQSDRAEICIHPFNGQYKDSDMSTNMSADRTIIGGFESKKPLELFLDILDAISKESLPPKLLELLELVAKMLKDMQIRIEILEIKKMKAGICSYRVDWKELVDQAEFRIIENGNHMHQKDLQKSLGIQSRTTMTEFVRLLKSTGRYCVKRQGRENIIEVIS